MGREIRKVPKNWNHPKDKNGRYIPPYDSEATHIMMYEKGTPISPAFATTEELSRWLADNNASAFGVMTATYDQWLHVVEKGYACSAVSIDDELIEALLRSILEGN